MCKVCIEGYFLNNNAFVKKIKECQKTDSEGKCIQCSTGFLVSKEGICIRQKVKIICPSQQYLSQVGVCVPGTTQNCQKYASLTGQCLECKEGYKLNDYNLCTIKCPKNTQSSKSVLINGKCVETDINCLVSNQDGFCQICQSEFYLRNGRCYQGMKQVQQKTQNLIIQEKLVTDSQGKVYLLLADKSRIYLTGSWKNLQVWQDGQNNLYTKVTNGGRKYLTGPFTGSIVFSDIEGSFYVITQEGKKMYVNIN